MKKKVSHAEPSKASLREMPEQRFIKGKSRRNPYIDRIRRDGLTFQIEGQPPIVLRERAAGRPKLGEEVAPNTPRNVRLPDALWVQLKKHAKRQGTTVSMVLRAAIADYLRAS